MLGSYCAMPSPPMNPFLGSGTAPYNRHVLLTLKLSQRRRIYEWGTMTTILHSRVSFYSPTPDRDARVVFGGTVRELWTRHGRPVKGTITLQMGYTSVAFGTSVTKPRLGARAIVDATVQANGPAKPFTQHLGCPDRFRITGPVIGLQSDVRAAIADTSDADIDVAGSMAKKIAIRRVLGTGY
jgi:hypothetical protein